ncbi:MAG: CHAT domain-containing protein [Bacteroidota bacterium]
MGIAFQLLTPMLVRTLSLACLTLSLTASGAAWAQDAEAERCTTELDGMRGAYVQALQADTPTYEDVLPWVADAFQCLGPTPTETHARVSEYETYVLLELGRLEQLVGAFERYFRDVAEAAPPNRHARQLTRYGFLLAQLNLHAESLAAYAEAAGLADQLTPLEAARQLSETGEHFRELNRLGEAARYFSAADSFFARSDDPPVYHAANLRMRQGRLLLSQAEVGTLDPTDAARQALPLLQSALVLFDQAGDQSERQRPTTYTVLGQTLRLLERFDDARRALDQAEAALAAQPDRVDQEVALLEESVYLALARGASEEAEAAALAMQLRAADVDHLDYLSISHRLLGDVAAQRADATSDAQFGDALLDDAEQYYRRATQYALDSRERYGLLDVAPSVWAAGQRPFRSLVRLYLQRGDADAAFLALDASRARYFADLLASTRRQEQLGARDRAALDSLYAVQEGARRSLDTLRNDVAERSRLTVTVQRAQIRIDSLTDAGTPDLRATGSSLSALQAPLRERDAALVTHVLFQDEGYVFALTPDTLAVAPVDVDVIGALLQTRSEGTPATLSLELLHQLYTHLLGPIAPVLDTASSLVVVPEGVLAQVPFSLLLTEPAASPYPGDVSYLVRRAAISTSLSASAMLRERRAHAPSTPLLALGRTFSDNASPDRRLDALAVRSGETWTPLPLVGPELATAQRYLGGTVLLDEAATKAAFFELGPSARVLHIASHALVDPDAALGGHILLAPDPDLASASPGVLYLSEIRQASLAAELVVLSACSTARGSAHLSEGMIGLQYAFQAAGAQSVLASLWPVNDAAMATIMASFYSHLADGLPKDRALQRAQIDYLDAHPGALSHPAYWGALVLQGSPAPLSAPSQRWVWLLVTGFFVLGGVYGARRLFAS